MWTFLYNLVAFEDPLGLGKDAITDQIEIPDFGFRSQQHSCTLADGIALRLAQCISFGFRFLASVVAGGSLGFHRDLLGRKRRAEGDQHPAKEDEQQWVGFHGPSFSLEVDY